MRRFITVLAVTLAALATPAVADEFSRSIPVTQADLQDPVAAAALYDRVATVAKSLCAKANDTLTGYTQTTMRARAACERDTIDKAITLASIPALTAVHAATLAQRAPSDRVTTIAAR